MSDKRDEKLGIAFSNNFSSDEVAEITDAFGKIVPVSRMRYGQDSIDATTVLVTVAIVTFIFFPLSKIADGFFESIGSDLYQKAKEKVVSAMKNKKNPNIQFVLWHKNVRIVINAVAKNEAELNSIFDTIAKARKIAINEIEKDSQIHEITIGYDVNVNGYWNVTFKA